MSENNNSSGPTATQQPQQQPHGTFMFFLPPPPTVWVQFNNGMQVAFTPSPASYLQSVFSGAPLFGSTGSGSGDNFLNQLNELFMRAQSQTHGPPPTSKPFLDKLPVKIWTNDMSQSEQHTECVICLSDYEKDDQVISLPCGHTFHKDCGMTWLVEHNVCPTCRYELPKQEPAVQATVNTSAAAPAAQPEQEPAAAEETTNTVTGVRRQRPDETVRPRDDVVRQRVEEPTSTNDEAELDHMLEQEADRFVKEEMEKRAIAAHDETVEIDDRDVEELLHGNESMSS